MFPEELTSMKELSQWRGQLERPDSQGIYGCKCEHKLWKREKTLQITMFMKLSSFTFPYSYHIWPAIKGTVRKRKSIFCQNVSQSCCKACWVLQKLCRSGGTALISKPADLKESKLLQYQLYLFKSGKIGCFLNKEHPFPWG